MRKLVSLLAVLLLALTLSSATAETRLTVTGTGEVLVPADTAVVSLGIAVRDQDALRAQERANEAIAAIRRVLEEDGIDPENISTGFVNLYPVYDYSGETEQITGYSASSSLAVRAADPAQAGRIIDLAFGAGANTLEGVSFSLSDETEARAAALEGAFSDAQGKAEVLARVSGKKITGIELIQEGASSSFDAGAGRFYAKASGMESSADQATVLRAAKISVSASVTVTFILE